MNRRWILEKNDSFATKLLLFFLWPFAAWLYSLKEPRSKSSYIVFFLFSLLLCWHMAPVGMNTNYDDFLGILERFEQVNLTTAEFFDEVKAFISFSSDAPKELYQDFLTWFTKLFTDNYHFFFLYAAIPIALLQLKTLFRITSDGQFYPCFFGIVAMMMMILPRDIITVQNPRFSTGLWLFVYCSFSLFSESKKSIKYLLPLILLPAIHSGMWPALFLVASFLVIPKNRTILEVMALASIPFVFIDPDILGAININILPANIVDWAVRYSSDEAYASFVLNEGRSGYWWVDSFFTIGLKITYVILTIQVITNKRSVALSEESSNFYPFFLFSFFFINMVQFIPVLGSRYYWMLQLFVFYEWYKVFHFSRKTPYWLLLFFYSWRIVRRYGYFWGGALSVNMPPDVFFTPLPYLVGKGLFW